MMLNNTLHKPVLRMIAAILGELLAAVALNFFIVPLGLYTGGLLGFCQLLRTVLQVYGGVDFGPHDVAGVLYFIVNIPILLLAYKNLGRTFVVKTAVCTLAYSLFYSVLPIPETPLVAEPLTACLIGGILAGVGIGTALTAGGSSGGLDVIGLYLSKKGYNVTVGKFSISFNAVLYTICLLLFAPEIALYSVIYNFFTAMVLDRMHQQNINIQAFIFTHQEDGALEKAVMSRLGRGVTYWQGVGAYTGSDLHVLCVCLSKFEIEELLQIVHGMDPQAFVTVQEHVRVIGNFPRKLE